MKKKLTLLIIALFAVHFSSFAVYTYIKVTCDQENPNGLNQEAEEPGFQGGGWTILQNGSAVTPAWSSNGTIPFNFSFNGTNYTSYKVSTTGVLTFDLAASAVPPAANTALPSSSIPNNSICIWGINGSGANDKIGRKTFGTAPNRQHWIWFTSYSIPGVTGTQWSYWAIVLEETTNNIYIVDQRTYPTTGLSVTLGVQIDNTTAYQVAGSPNINTFTTQGGVVDDPSDNVYYKIGSSLAGYDIKANSLSLQTAFPYKPFPTTNTLSGKLVNLGSQNLTSIVLNYSVDGAAPVSSSPLSVNIISGGCYNYSHPIAWTPASAGWHNVKFWVSNLNTNHPDEYNLNDTLSAKLYFYAAMPTTHKVVFEEATGTWCGWCPRGTVFMDSSANLFPNSTVLIAVHGGALGEPLMDATYATGIENLVGGFPTMVIDRVFQDDPLNPNGPADMYNAHSNDFGVGDVDFTVGYNSGNRQSTVSVNVTSAVNIDGNYRLACVYTENGVTGPGDGSNATNTSDFDQVNYYSVAWNNANGTTPPGPLAGAGHDWAASPNPIPATNMHYNYVARTIQGGFLGQAGSLPSNMTAGGVYTYTFPVYTVPSAYNVANMKVSVLLIDADNNIIMNGDSKSLLAVGINDPASNHYEISVFPNPATDHLDVAVGFKENEKAKLTITDLLGKVCVVQDLGNVSSGMHRFPVNINNLSAGTYFITLQGNKGSSTTKFIK